MRRTIVGSSVLILGLAFAVPSQPVEGAELSSMSPTLSSNVNPSSTYNTLTAVSARSATHAWAVGYYKDDATGATDTLILRWDGTSWRPVASPNPSSTFNELLSVSAVSANGAWAVGSYVDDTSGTSDTLILHREPTGWVQVPSPDPSSTFNKLRGVSAYSATDAWAIGSFGHAVTGAFDTLILHWDGRDWSKVRSPSPSHRSNTLDGVSADSANDVWAVGYLHTGRTVSLHWDGTRWEQVKSPSPSKDLNYLHGVSVLSATDAWAVGDFRATTPFIYKTLILRRKGRGWSRVKAPSPSHRSNTLFAVSADASDDVWAVGSVSRHRTLILHWDGTKWSKVTSPNPSSRKNWLYGVSADSANDAWGVGYYKDDAIGARDVLILHWDGTSWSQS